MTLNFPGHGILAKPCEKILHFDFTRTFDSFSCHNFAKGEPYGDPSLNGDVLCLNGEDQFLTVNKRDVVVYAIHIYVCLYEMSYMDIAMCTGKCFQVTKQT